MMVKTCPACGGKYGGSHTHDHTNADIFDSRFANCEFPNGRGCKGRGAITCETCEGTGRLAFVGIYQGQVVWAPDHKGAADRNSRAMASMTATEKGMTPAKPERDSDARKLHRMVKDGLTQDFEKK